MDFNEQTSDGRYTVWVDTMVRAVNGDYRAASGECLTLCWSSGHLGRDADLWLIARRPDQNALPVPAWGRRNRVWP